MVIMAMVRDPLCHIFGSEVINLFDIKYDIEDKKRQLMEAAEAKAEKKRADEAKERAEQRLSGN